MQTIYVEEQVLDDENTTRILQRFASRQVIICDKYTEVFNPAAQNFRLQKQNPAIILAKKTGNFVLPTPESFGIGGANNYYFSHMLNCPYDCRYCFLQGMYPSAHKVIFVNYADFKREIKMIADTLDEQAYFFSGYDCDSLAYDGVTQFVDNFVPYFSELNNAIIELRTKSTNVRSLLNHPAHANCVIAFSFTPDEISRHVEHGVPSVAKRINAMQRLAQMGWQLGLRFDPLIYADNFQELYHRLIHDIFAAITSDAIHSVSIGPMRFPAKMFRRIVDLYPHDKLLSHPLEKRDNHYSYSSEREQAMKHFVIEELSQYLQNQRIFQCSAL